MGSIEEAIFKNYKKALDEGNLEQAKIGVKIAKLLKEMVETEGFVDLPSKDLNQTLHFYRFFEPFPYRYYPDDGFVVINNSAIRLTYKENRLFWLFSQNETSGEKINIVTRDQLKTHMWGIKKVSVNALRIAILRLRRKIELNLTRPQLIISIYTRGYIFLGKRIFTNE